MRSNGSGAASSKHDNPAKLKIPRVVTSSLITEVCVRLHDVTRVQCLNINHNTLSSQSCMENGTVREKDMCMVVYLNLFFLCDETAVLHGQNKKFKF